MWALMYSVCRQTLLVLLLRSLLSEHSVGMNCCSRRLRQHLTGPIEVLKPHNVWWGLQCMTVGFYIPTHFEHVLIRGTHVTQGHDTPALLILGHPLLASRLAPQYRRSSQKWIICTVLTFIVSTCTCCTCVQLPACQECPAAWHNFGTCMEA